MFIIVYDFFLQNELYVADKDIRDTNAKIDRATNQVIDLYMYMCTCI